MSRHYEHVIFDFDGVLCDSLALAMHEFNELRRESFSALPPVGSQDDMTIVFAGSLRSCLHKWLTPEEGRRFFDAHSARMRSHAGALPTFEGIGKLLASLGRGGFSIVTSAYSNSVKEILAADPEYDPDALHMIVDREVREPKTIKINTVLASLGLDTSRAVYVGDLESDILYCRDVPIDIIAVGFGYHPPWYLEKKGPTYLVSTVGELSQLLGQKIHKQGQRA